MQMRAIQLKNVSETKANHFFVTTAYGERLKSTAIYCSTNLKELANVSKFVYLHDAAVSKQNTSCIHILGTSCFCFARNKRKGARGRLRSGCVTINRKESEFEVRSRTLLRVFLVRRRLWRRSPSYLSATGEEKPVADGFPHASFVLIDTNIVGINFSDYFLIFRSAA